MPGCAVSASSMTGSTDLGPIQPQQDSIGAMLDECLFTKDTGQKSPNIKRNSRNMSSAAQPIQLTPVWEYAVKYQEFPSGVDVVKIFVEIDDRLGDPEWEVRQHALRVLVDVLPTIDTKIIDHTASLILSELIDNLGHPAPAVRKGSLDALRVYLSHSPTRNEVTKRILKEGMNRSAVLDTYQSNITTGVILSTPLILFPSRSVSRPSNDVIREAIQSLAGRLIQIAHQESALRSLSKIKESIGKDDFVRYINEIDPKMNRNFELLCDVYGIGTKTIEKPNKIDRVVKEIDNDRRGSLEESIKKISTVGRIKEDNDDGRTKSVSSPDRGNSGRVVLETEIKFDQETAITMTILEEENNKADETEDSEDDTENDWVVVPRDPIFADDKGEGFRKTQRRVHFGGEDIKPRTPDSEDTDSVISELVAPLTRIPLPVSPATRMPQHRRRIRSSSHPRRSSRNIAATVGKKRRAISNSPRREVHIHDGSLSPKKSILSSRGRYENFDKNGDFDRRSRIDFSNRNKRAQWKSARERNRDYDVDYSPRRTRSISSESFRVFDDPPIPALNSPLLRKPVEARNIDQSPSPSLLGPCVNLETDSLVPLFGDPTNYVEKRKKDFENHERSSRRSRSADNHHIASIRESWQEHENRSHSAKIPGYEIFPRQERNYILMELESGRKSPGMKVRSKSQESLGKSSNVTLNSSVTNSVQNFDAKEMESLSDRNARVSFNNSANSISDRANDSLRNVKEYENNLRDRSPDMNSDSERSDRQLDWEELGIVDEEVLEDFHNQDDWRARVRGLERIASSLRSSSALTAIEPRLGSLLHAMLGGERCSRVAAAGMAVAKVVISGVSEEALRRHLSLIAWGLARQGGPSAANLARLTMLRTSPGLFLEKLLQSHCLCAKNAKMRENTLQLLIFSLVTFPSTEFKVNSAIYRVVSMVGDRRKRVRHSALDTLAVLGQMYEPEDILEASKEVTKNKPDGPAMVSAIRTRLSRKLLPTVTADGLVMYGLQLSPNSEITGADVDWILGGTGSVSPGTGRTRGQLVVMDNADNDTFDNYNAKRVKRKADNDAYARMMEDNERIATWKTLPQSEKQRDTRIPQIIPRKNQTISKSADQSSDDEQPNEKQSEKNGQLLYQPYSTPKRTTDRRISVDHDSKSNRLRKNKDYISQFEASSNSAPAYNRTPLKFDSRIPVLSSSRDRTPTRIKEATPERESKMIKDATGVDSKFFRKKLQSAPNYVNCQYANNDNNSSYRGLHNSRKFNDPLDYLHADVEEKFRDDSQRYPIHEFKENQRIFSYEKLDQDRDDKINDRYRYKDEEMFESIYERQYRLKKEKIQKTYDTYPLSPDFEYQIFNRNKNAENNNNNVDKYFLDKEKFNKNLDILENKKYSQKIQRPLTYSPFERHYLYERSLSERETNNKQSKDDNNQSERCNNHSDALSQRSVKHESNNLENRNSPSHDVNATVRSNSGSSTISNRSASVKRQSSTPLSNNDDVNYANGDLNQSNRYYDSQEHAFNLINAKNTPISSGRHSHDSHGASIRTEIEVEEEDRPSTTTSSDDPQKTFVNDLSVRESDKNRNNTLNEQISPGNSRNSSARSGNREVKTVVSRSLESLISDHSSEDQRNVIETPDSHKSSYSNSSASEREQVNVVKNVMHIENGDKNSDSSTSNADVPFQTLDFRNDDEKRVTVRTDEVDFQFNEKVNNCSSNHSSPKRFVTVLPEHEVESVETPPVPIGFDSSSRTGTSSTDEISNDGARTERSRSPTPASQKAKSRATPTKNLKNPRMNGHRAMSVPMNKHIEKQHAEKSKLIHQCFVQLDSKDWETQVKGLTELSQIAREDPVQLDSCTPGILARMLGKEIKSLRSQVTRAACTTVTDVFHARVRGMEQDLDELAGPLLHRTADTNRFIRDDCNATLDTMIRYFPPHRTIVSIVNRGATHQNAIARAATARLLCSLVEQLGPKNVMALPKDARDKLFVASAKLLTDGNLNARNYAKQIFRQLSKIEGFRRILNDTVPEATLRNIEKALKTL